MESKIKMESTYIPDIQYSINVYQFAMKRESWKMKKKNKKKKKKKKKRTWKEGLKGDLGPPVLSLHSHNSTRF
jgi:hypothetical protein